MTASNSATVIKKYANRRLYHTGTSAYVTLDDLAEMVRRGEDFVVQDAKTGEDITRGVLGQIIFDAEAKGSGLLPIAFLRQLITFYNGQMQTLVPSYLEHSLANFAREQGRFSAEMNKALGASSWSAVEDQARRNMELFERSMRMFVPFGQEGDTEKKAEEPGALASDVAALRSELAAMQAKVDAMSKQTAPPVPPPAGEADEDGDETAFFAEPIRRNEG